MAKSGKVKEARKTRAPFALLSRSDQVPLTGGGLRGWVTPDLLKVKEARLLEPLLLLVNQFFLFRAETWECGTRTTDE